MSGHCLFCGSSVGGDDACELCGVRRVVTGEKRVGALCPRCAHVRLSPLEVGPVVVQGCSSCGGMFVATTEWDAILELTRDRPLPDVILVNKDGERLSANPYRVSPYEEQRASVTDLEALVTCTVCKDAMERIEFAGVSRIFVDVCASHGIWLDAGELAMVVARVRQNAYTAITENETALAEAEQVAHGGRVTLFVSGLLRLLRPFYYRS